MKNVLVAVIFALILVSSAAEKAKLRIGTRHRPDDCKDVAKIGDTLTMHYRGTLAATGEVFDDSHKRGSPFDFVLGRGMVIRGFDLGAEGMCVGEERRLEIPAELGYGAHGAGGVIPPNADLIFDIELVAIHHPRGKKAPEKKVEKEKTEETEL